MPTSRFKFVIVSKDTQFRFARADFAQFECITDIKFISNNKDGLPVVYNRELQSVRASNDADFVVFMHADVKFDISSFIQKILTCADKYDVFGLCGTSVMNVSMSPLNWWTGSNPTPEAKWGCVTHGELGNVKSFFSRHSPDVLDHEAACIDGLCIVFGPKALASKMQFNQQFSFDFYDTDISFQTILTYGLKLGVIVEQSLQHYSIGRSILTDDFLRSEAQFRQVWNLPAVTRKND